MRLFNRFLRVEIQKQVHPDTMKTTTNILDAKFGGDEFMVFESPLHIRVRVEKSLSLVKNHATITMYNLSRASLKNMQTLNNLVRIHAGYGKDTYLIYVGRIQSIQPSWEVPDYKIEIKCGSAFGVGEVEATKAEKQAPVLIDKKLIPVSVSFPATTTWEAVLTECTKLVAMGLQLDQELAPKPIGAPFAFAGTMYGLLQAIGKRLKPLGYFALTHKYNQVIIWTQNKLPTNTKEWGTWKVQRIDAQSGLIEVADASGQMNQDFLAELAKRSLQRRLVRCKTLFLPLIDVNEAVSITSKQLSLTGKEDTVYGVIEDCEWELCNFEQDFYITFYVMSQQEVS